MLILFTVFWKLLLALQKAYNLLQRGWAEDLHSALGDDGLCYEFSTTDECHDEWVNEMGTLDQ